MGRAARHVDGRVLLYADTMTASMRTAIEETERRREIQAAHNAAHGITPQGIRKAIRDLGERLKAVAESRTGYEAGQPIPKEDIAKLVKDLERQMKEAARSMEFERAALLRDQIYELRATLSDADTPDTALAPIARRDSGAGDGATALAAEAATARASRAARSPSRYGGGRRRR
jgi:excinuclease ABC subunit B